MPCTTITQRQGPRPPIWSRIPIEHLRDAAPACRLLAAQVRDAMRIPEEPDAIVLACLQTTGRLVIQVRNRQPIKARKAMAVRHLSDAAGVRWVIPGPAYLPLSTSVPWYGGVTPEQAMAALAKRGLDRSESNADLPDRLSRMPGHIRKIPRKRIRAAADFTRPLVDYAKNATSPDRFADID